jgi:RimJ/RimL family protein N-acetyltransferase
MTFERTKDYALVRQIMVHPKIWPHISDDLAPPASEFQPQRTDAIWYVLAVDECKVLGMFAFVPQNGVCWDVHTCLLPRAWGGPALDAARAVAPWIWANTDCRRIITTVPAYNRLALRLARAAGMREFGVNHRSYLKYGKLHDQVLLGLSPEDQHAHCGGSTSDH